MVRKGGSDRDSSLSLLAVSHGRGDLLDLGIGVGGGIGARLDLRPITLELRGGATLSRTENQRLTVDNARAVASCRRFASL